MSREVLAPGARVLLTHDLRGPHPPAHHHGVAVSADRILFLSTICPGQWIESDAKDLGFMAGEAKWDVVTVGEHEGWHVAGAPKPYVFQESHGGWLGFDTMDEAREHFRRAESVARFRPAI